MHKIKEEYLCIEKNQEAIEIFPHRGMYKLVTYYRQMKMLVIILLQWKLNIVTCIGVLFTASIVLLKTLWTCHVSQMEIVIRVESF